jgi:hypothetical protein
MRRQISLELSTLTSQYDLFIKTTSDGEKHEILTDVLDGRNIQTKKEVVMQGRKLHKVTRKKISSHDSHAHHYRSDGGSGHRHDDDDDDVMNMVESGVDISRSKPLSELTVGEVGTLLEALKLGKYKEALLNNEIDGKCLVECSTVDEVIEMGISLSVKAKYFLKEIKKLQQLMKADDETEMDDINTEMQMNMVTTHKVELFA